MSSKVTAALQNLNKATGERRQYDIRQNGDRYTLLLPEGGSYPAATENVTVERLIALRNAAAGRNS